MTNAYGVMTLTPPMMAVTAPDGVRIQTERPFTEFIRACIRISVEHVPDDLKVSARRESHRPYGATLHARLHTQQSNSGAAYLIANHSFRILNAREPEDCVHPLFELQKRDLLPRLDSWAPSLLTLEDALPPGPTMEGLQSWLYRLATQCLTAEHELQTKMPTEDALRLLYSCEAKSNAVLRDMALQHDARTLAHVLSRGLQS